jgi:hypothetical protein
MNSKTSRKRLSFHRGAISMLLAALMACLPAMQKAAQAAPSTSVPAIVPLAQQPAPGPQTPPSYPPPPPSPWQAPPGSVPYGYPPPGSGDAAAGTARGTLDAEADTSGALWFLAGCGLGVIGILIAYVAEPTPPVARIMGKSPEYVMAYTAAYKTAGKSVQGRQALYGCIVGTAVAVAIYLVLVAAVLHEASMSTTY